MVALRAVKKVALMVAWLVVNLEYCLVDQWVVH